MKSKRTVVVATDQNGKQQNLIQITEMHDASSLDGVAYIEGLKSMWCQDGTPCNQIGEGKFQNPVTNQIYTVSGLTK